MVELVRRDRHRVVPWKNGRGSTTEIAVAPAGADLSGFDWRLSAARVDEDGPFSSFPGVDRTLVLLEGEGIDLVTPDGALAVAGRFALARFPGDLPVVGRLRAGPIRDLNVMTRRAAFSHAAEVVPVEGPRVLAPGSLAVAVVLEGRITVGGAPLEPLEAAIAPGPLAVDGAGHVLHLRLWRAAT